MPSERAPLSLAGAGERAGFPVEHAVAEAGRQGVGRGLFQETRNSRKTPPPAHDELLERALTRASPGQAAPKGVAYGQMGMLGGRSVAGRPSRATCTATGAGLGALAGSRADRTRRNRRHGAPCAARRRAAPRGRKLPGGLFDEFSDHSGRPLRDALDADWPEPAGYLRQILFYDGSRHRLCQAGRVLAVASPGSRVVQVCPEAIRNRYRRDPRYVEAILIHEALHTLGLAKIHPRASRSRPG